MGVGVADAAAAAANVAPSCAPRRSSSMGMGDAAAMPPLTRRQFARVLLAVGLGTVRGGAVCWMVLTF